MSENETNPPYDPEGVNLMVRTLVGRRNMMIAAMEDSFVNRVRLFIGKMIECNRLHKFRYGLGGRKCYHWKVQ